jgi:hypothetical protein
MGRLTDSLRETSDELEAIESGIDRMNVFGQELLKNTAEVAQSALGVGYLVGKQEVEMAEPESNDPLSADPDASYPALPAIEELQAELKQLRSSQSSLRTANDRYRLQKIMVQIYLKQANLDPKILAQVDKIYQLSSIRSAPSLASSFLNFDRSQILKLLRQVVVYSKHLIQ